MDLIDGYQLIYLGRDLDTEKEPFVGLNYKLGGIEVT